MNIESTNVLITDEARNGRSAICYAHFSSVFNSDCVEGMKQYPDNYFDLAIVDPPYGLGNRLSDGGGKLKNTPMAALYRNKEWDILPEKEYWNELFRVSKNQIVFGANYFWQYLKNSRGIISWDKKQDMPTLSAFELVWTSFDKPSKIYKKSSTDLDRFHPTQKPIALYDFCFNYAKVSEGMKILDTHLGSGSSRISAFKNKLHFTAFEIDTEYFERQEKRFNNFTAQGRLF
jgi:site-specific DNA-methyltransferase (adenine-specific)